MGLTKFFRLTFLDLIDKALWPEPEARRARELVARYFDRIELAIAIDWASLSENEKITEVQDKNRAKSAFLATMTHELRTPLNGVLGAMRLIRDEGLTEAQNEFADTVERSGEAPTPPSGGGRSERTAGVAVSCSTCRQTAWIGPG